MSTRKPKMSSAAAMGSFIALTLSVFLWISSLTASLGGSGESNLYFSGAVFTLILSIALIVVGRQKQPKTDPLGIDESEQPLIEKKQPIRKFLGLCLFAGGAMVAMLAGSCTLSEIANVTHRFDPLTLLVGGTPTLFGCIACYLGWRTFN